MKVRLGSLERLLNQCGIILRGKFQLSDVNSLCDELKELVVDTLALEDVTWAEIETEAPLFGDGLDLDSIDALEIAMAIEEKYGVTLGDDPDQNQKIFVSIKTLADFVLGSS